MLYALGVGLGHDPLNADELAFVYEKNLKVLPTFAADARLSGLLAARSRTGIDWAQGRERRAGPACCTGRSRRTAR